MRRAQDRSTGSPGLFAMVVTAIALTIVACSGSDSNLSAEAARGKQISVAKGCAGCHGQNGEGGVGPTWVGLAGSQVELFDGSTVVADDEYLIRSIKEPAADLLADYFVQMPQNELTDAEVADVVAYIKELGTAGNGG